MYGSMSPRRVDVAHPVVAVRVDPEVGEQVDERLGVMARVGGMAVRDLVRDVGQRHAHVAVDRVRRQECLGVHRVEVVDAVQQRRLVPGGSQRPGDDVEDDRPTEAADVDGAGGRLRVVDDLRARDPRRQLVRPVHTSSPARARATRPAVPAVSR